MSFENFIDSVAAFSKLGIEMSGRSPDNRKFAETQVDCLSSLLKLIQPYPKQNLTIQGINFEWVRNIKQIAQQYFVDRVIIFPYPIDQQNIVTLMRVYGTETTEFLCAIGFSHIDRNSITAEENAALTQWENEYGVILYERELGK